MATDHADVVFRGGPVHTMEPARPSGAGAGAPGPAPTAVAVRGGRIVAVGVDDEVTALAGPHTEVVDLRGRALLPGFQDAHVHPALGGLSMLRCELHGATDAAACLDRVRAYAAANPDRPWILGGGWSMAFFPGGTPGKELLDAIVPDRPVLLTNRDGHGAWANSRALELAGVDARTPDPADGRIERGPGGGPSGTLHEGAVDLVGRLAPAATFGERLAGLLAGQAHLHAFGITGWQDALLGDYLGDGDPTELYLAAAEAGTLTARVVGALWWDRDRGLEQLDDLVDKRNRAQAGRFAATSVKLMQDGVPENFTAGMLAPYLDGHDHPTTNSGLSMIDPDLLKDAVTGLDRLGFQAHFHAIGDRAVRECLDAVAAAREANGPDAADLRHHIAHVQVIHPDDVPRFAALGVAANMQPLWAVHEPQMDDLVIPFIGEERARWQYPFAALLRSGARLAAGSDWSVTSPDVFWGIHVAVNRATPRAALEGAAARPAFLPEQRLGRRDAVAAYTTGSAWVNHLEATTGSITPGKYADLVVVDRDPFAVPDDELGETRVVATYVEGAAVHRAG